MNAVRLLVLACLASSAWLQPVAADSFRAFGLTNSPLGDADITFEGGTMTVTSAGSSGFAPIGGELLPAGTFGVSILLGDADAGIWASPYHNGYVNDENFL